ncbi:Mitochondrial fission protein [Dimargaris verticillata]|uniref:Mitochondrial fission protein n=1 Tax=Dimargaris verticillata TaxID=2761393 RepID=A0A9W8B8L4_9FUNG|nr:Mitochondrial fission protein [Dimargaris verticillata]
MPTLDSLPPRPGPPRSAIPARRASQPSGSSAALAIPNHAKHRASLVSGLVGPNAGSLTHALSRVLFNFATGGLLRRSASSTSLSLVAQEVLDHTASVGAEQTSPAPPTANPSLSLFDGFQAQVTTAPSPSSRRTLRSTRRIPGTNCTQRRRGSIGTLFDANAQLRPDQLDDAIHDLEARRMQLLEELTQVDGRIDRLLTQQRELASFSPSIFSASREPSPTRSMRSAVPAVHDAGIDDTLTQDRPRVPTLVQSLPTHSSIITSVAYHPSHDLFMTGSTDTTACLWPLSDATGNQPSRYKLGDHNDVVRCVQFATDYAVTGSVDTTIAIWDLAGIHPSPAQSENSFDGNIDPPQGRQLIRSLADSFTAAAYHAKENLYSRPVLSNVEANHSNASLATPPEPHEEHSSDLALQLLNELPTSPMASTVPAPMSASRSSDLPLVHRLTTHQGAITCLQASGAHLVSGSADKTVKYWDLHQAQEIMTMDVLWSTNQDPDPVEPAHPGLCHRNPAGDEHGLGAFLGALQFYQYALVTGTWDGLVRMWDLRTGQCHRSLTGHQGAITSVALHGWSIVSGSLDQSVRIWDLRMSQCVEHLKYSEPVWDLDFDGTRTVTTLGTRALHVYNTRTFQRSKFTAHQAPIHTVALCPAPDNDTRPAWDYDGNGLQLFCGGRDGVVTRWLL